MIPVIKRAEFARGPRQAADELARDVIAFTAGTGAQGGVVGLSGGIDSTTVAYLTKYAFDQYNATHNDKLSLTGVILPSLVNQSKDQEDGERVAKLLGIESLVVPIEPIAEAFVTSLDCIDNPYDRGNLYSETRAVVLSRVAASRNARVMGTGNRDEDYVLGYFTKRGDGAVDNNILGNVPKRLVRTLATYLGVPTDLVSRTPTAGLWANQTDDGELGYTYEQAEIIQDGYDQGLGPKEIAAATGYDPLIIADVKKRHDTNEHKRVTPPVGNLSLVYREVML